MKFEIEFASVKAQQEFKDLPTGLRAKGAKMLELIKQGHIGGELSKHLVDELFEIRIKAKEGIARSIYCYRIGAKIIILRTFVKKSQATPRKELEIALARLKEYENE